MKKVVFLSWHYYNSKRKAGFHFLADSLKSQGFDVTFITSVVSILTYIRRDGKIFEEKFNANIFKPQSFNEIKSIVNFSLFQPPLSRSSALLEWLARMFFKLNRESIKEICNADYVVFESLASIRFFDSIKLLNPNAKLVYRVSDDLEASNTSKKTLECERNILSSFDLVSVPTNTMFEKFLKLSPKNVRLHFHGISKDLYDRANVNPYSEKINHIFVGNSLLDQKFLDIASTIFSDHKFHIIGNFEVAILKSNVVYHGYMPFEDTIPYVKFATTGLQIRTNADGIAETLSDSLKMLQYSYCSLPVIAPVVMPAHHRENIFYYKYGDECSIRECIEHALNFDRNEFSVSIKSWNEVAMELTVA